MCNETYCDTLEFDLPKNNGDILVFTTSESGERFNKSRLSFEKIQNRQDPLSFLRSTLNIDRSKKFQTFLGFGNHFTGAVSHQIDKVPNLKDEIYRSYFNNETGLGFNFMRIPIGGTDFDHAPWAYNELPENDTSLSGFTELDQRDLHRVEQLKDLMKVCNKFDIKFIGSAWR